MWSRNLHSTVAVLGLLLTVVGTFLVRDFVEKIASERFFNVASSYHSVINDGFLEYLSMMHAVGGLFHASQEVTEAEFTTFVEKLLTHSKAVEAIHWMPDPEFGSRKQTRLTSLTPKYSINTIESDNLDIGGELVLLKTIHHSMEQRVMAGKEISFIHRFRERRGFEQFELDIIYPVFKAERLHKEKLQVPAGYIWSHVKIRDLLESSLKRIFSAPSGIDIIMTGPTMEMGEEVIYYHPSRMRKDAPLRITMETVRSGTFKVENIVIEESVFQLIFKPTDLANFFPLGGYIPWMFALAGLVVNALLFIYLHSNVRHLATVRELADKQVELRILAEEADRAKSTFLATMSHEIRTPMNAVLGMLELLREAPLEQQHMEKIKIAFGSGRSLLALINNILDYSKIEAGQFSLDQVEFNLRELLYDVVRSMAILAQAKQIELVGYIPQELPAAMIGDPNRIRQIFANLIGNAIKFTPEGGRIECHGGPMTQDADSIEYLFEVRDTGIGIPADQREYVFDQFTQSERSSGRQYGGTGLGLTICKRLVEMMDGGIEVDENPHAASGSIFHFTIKLEKAAHGAVQQRHSALQEVRTLIVGSDGMQLVLLVNALGAWGLRQEESCELHKARESIKGALQDGNPYGLIIVNKQPQDDLLGQLGAVHGLDDAACYIILTDFLDQSWDNAAYMPGNTVCLKKPVNTMQLHNAIIQLFNVEAASLPPTLVSDVKIAANRVGHQGVKVLVVDDVYSNLQVIVGMLTALGMNREHCQVAKSGKEAVELFKKGGYDMVFMDCQMPDIDGYQATEAIRYWEKAENLAPCKIIAFTADVTPESRRLGHAAGMDDFLNKPVTIPALSNMVARYLPTVSAVVDTETGSEAGRDPAKTPTPLNGHGIKNTLLSIGLPEHDLPEIARVISFQLPELINNLARDLETSDADLVRATSHVLKGSMVNVLFPALKSHTSQLHENIKAEDWQQAREQLSQVRKVYAPIAEELRAYIGDAATH